MRIQNRKKTGIVFTFVLLFCGSALHGNVHAQSASGSDSEKPSASKDEARFELLELRVLGNSVLEAKDIERVVYPYLGEQKSLEDVEKARAALEAVYHERGYGTVFVDIPEQSVTEGIVRLRVTEGRLRHTTVSGARYFSGREIRSALLEATADSVPNIQGLQSEITALNTQTRDRVVVPVLKAGPTPGTVDLALKVDDHLPLHGSLELNNQYSADTSTLRALGAISYDNLFGRLDSISLQYQASPQKANEVGVFAVSYSAALNSSGTRGAVYYVDSKNDVATLGTLSVLGKGKIYGLRLIQPLGTTANSMHMLTLGADYKDFAQDIRLDPESTFRTPISYLNFSAGYAGNWHTSRVQWGLETTVNFGVRDVANRTEEFADKRFQAQPNYSYLRSSANVDLRLPADFTLSARIAGQFSVDPVISNEQYTIGGAESVRGYLEAEEIGDMGVLTSLQLGSPQVKALMVNLQAFLFFDAARVNTIASLPNEPTHSELRSWGAGVKLAAYESLTGLLTWAYPLVDATRTHAGDSRILFVVRSTW